MTPNVPIGLTMSSSVVSTVGRAFDLAWQEIADQYGTKTTRGARDRLARIMLANPMCETGTVDELKRAGVVTMAAAERARKLR